MPIVKNSVRIPDVDLRTVWSVLIDFERFPDLMEDVVSVKCYDRTQGRLKSSWVVLLNGSELTWDEEDFFIDDREIRFAQTEGDLDVWEGNWTAREDGSDVVVDLTVEFDLGIPSLADILNPIGIRAINANTRQMLAAIKGTTMAAS